MSAASGPPPRGSEFDSKLLENAQVVLVTTPAFVRMQNHPEFQNWAADLVQFGQLPDLRPIAHVLEQVAANALAGDLETIMEMLRQAGSTLDLWTLMRASITASDSDSGSPPARFVLAWVALCIWILGASARGEDLFVESNGWPHPGWAFFPFSCAAAATKLGCLCGSALLAQEPYERLQASWHRHPDHGAKIEPVIAQYQRLAEDIAGRYDAAVASLADDLSEAWRAGEGRVRFIIAALFWSLGMVPASRVYCTAPPGRALLRKLIRLSMQLLPDDPLIQYIWLEMKEEAGVDLRSHEALFTLLNHNWAQWWLDVLWPGIGNVQPSRLYARTLVSFIAGGLDEAAAAGYLQAYDQIIDGKLDVPGKAFVLHRLHMLRQQIGEHFHYYLPEVTDTTLAQVLKERIETVGLGRDRLAGRNPVWPDALGRTSIATFDFIDRCFSPDSRVDGTENERSVMVLETLERFRVGALAYWLRVNPPLTPVADNSDPKIRSLLRKELKLIEQLRGAYYLTLRPILPVHLEWSDVDYRLLRTLDDPKERERFYSPDVAREELGEIESALEKVAKRLRTLAPEYASRRLAPAADLNRIVATLNLHTGASAQAAQR